MILERINDTLKPAVLQVSDGHRTDDLMCMAILTRARYLDQRYLFHPDFFSMYSDNWFSECAHRDGVVIDARDLVFEHLHPAFGKGEMDEVYKRSNDFGNYVNGQCLFNRLSEGAITSWDVEGWCDFRDLYTAIARALPDGATVAEIGVWKGQSVIHLAQRMQDMGKRCMIHAIDTFQGDDDTGKEKTLVQFTENIERAGVGGIVYPLPDQSIIAATRFDIGELDMVFIDGAHDYDSVYSDLTAWLPRVKDGGILAGHDIDSPDVQRALEDAGIEYHVVGRCWVRKNQTNE
jgi:hypothetical protein